MEKKIIFFHPYFRDGGVERTNIRLGRYFMQQGYQVEFLSLFFEGQIQEEAKEAGIELTALKRNRTSQAITAIRKHIKDEKKKYHVAIISCQNYANIIMWMALIGIRKGVRLIFTERNNPASLEQFSISKKDKITLWLMKCLYRHADGVVAISQELADDLSKLVHTPVRCIYNPTFSENFEVMAEEHVEDTWFEEDIPIVLSVGRLERQKDFPTLIKAFRKVRDQQKCRLVIVGDGSKRTELEGLIGQLGLKEDVHLLGFDRNPYKYMAKADVFVVSSIYEGLCNTVIEATALKTPCVVTDCKSGPKEILLYGKGGKVVSVGDVEAMAEAIRWTLSNPKEAEQLMLQAYEGLQRFTAEEAGKKYLVVIEQK